MPVVSADAKRIAFAALQSSRQLAPMSVYDTHAVLDLTALPIPDVLAIIKDIFLPTGNAGWQ